MAEPTTPDGTSAVPNGPGGEPATPPRLVPLVLLYTLGRVVILVALVALFWVVGLPQLPALLFGVLLSMPVAYVLLRPLRDRLTEALAARSVARRTAKEQLRARLSGEDAEQPAG